MRFFKYNWMKILIENLVEFLSTLATFFIVFSYSFEKFDKGILLTFIITPILLPVFIIVEWYHNKNIIKKYHTCFRKTVIWEPKNRNTGDGSLC